MSMAFTPIKESKQEHSGLSVDYYKLAIHNPIHFKTPYDCECQDIISALNMSFSEAEAFKAIWRKAAQRLGKAKVGNNGLYDAQKVEHYGKVMQHEEIAVNVKDSFNYLGELQDDKSR